MSIKPKLFVRKVDKTFLTRVKVLTRYTPDLAYLQQFEYQLLFVPDNWMSGHIDHDRICNEEMVYPTAFTRDQFSMVYKPLGIESYPIALETTKEIEIDKKWADPNRTTVRHKQAKIRGQVWAVTPNTFLNLDKKRENGVVFSRKRVVIDIPIRKIQDGDTKYIVSNSDDELLIFNYKGERVYKELNLVGNLKVYPRKMWMYVGLQDYWSDMLDSGGFELPSVRIFRPRNPILQDYFYWMKDGDHNK